MTTGHEERTLVVGLGKTGLSVARFLAARGESVAVTDSRETPPMLDELREQLPDVALFTGEFSEQLFATAERIIVSPGVDLRQLPLSEAMMRGAEVMGDIELFARYADAPVVAITGSNGKSTVTALVGAMVEAAGREVRLGGNYGTPALDLLQEQAPDLYVLELSSFQLETTNTLQCESAAVLNISADHMDRYNDLEAYISAKRRIFHNTAVCVVNCDDMAVTDMVRGEENVVCFTLKPPKSGEYGLLEAGGEQWLCYGDQRLMAAAELRMVGSHNCANVLAAMALGSAAGLALEPMVEAARHFTGLPHRCQWVAEAEGVRWFNDSKGTNVGATIAAIEGIAAPVVLIAGGEGKGADFAPLREALADKGRAVVLFGRDASLIESAVNGATDVVHAADLDEAVAKAAALAKSGDAVLFSPACASFDMFRNYEERGERFVEAVGRLLA
ncbi:UDP-N-acetylmuramoyl-L-alanine--D-glutamate ligase [Solemya pervernicosa gill symbiont]|uniref:UDP-N-acetylmuramoylalanine--D-glutamate ligase n=3 Tax=Gammaproteobacteria incertae sedis TaxID=118884 RepID=A0A1T2L9X7_9GAMM|nr:UDP-N-acetylmuramoyl-L-alanine--D-glutamate ligase [Solemya pervernicosa gill symbiont]QKQ28203.1 UDP-N-acetylmuramoyl-L-alanine--D-glutamate ligase [Candidatus Reidiella endopervernicosa]